MTLYEIVNDTLREGRAGCAAGFIAGYFIGDQQVKFRIAGGNLSTAATYTGIFDVLTTAYLWAKFDRPIGEALVSSVQGDLGCCFGVYVGLLLGKTIGKIHPAPGKQE